MAYRFVTDRDESVQVALTNLSADVDLYVVDSVACRAEDCIATSTESASADEQLLFDAVSGEEYVLIIDGWQGATTDFRLEVTCQGNAPGADAGPPETGAGDAGDDGSVSGGCSTSGGGGSAGLALILIAVVARRRRT